MKSVLMIAYHFPPLAGSSGVQRTLRFVQHLPALGWRPLVLTANPMAYEQAKSDLLGEIPEGVPVVRAFALDAARHLSIGGRYLGFTARPDRWVSWRFAGVMQGMRMIRRFRPSAIWSTFPIATAHMIGAELSHRARLPWIADFRDPMAQDDYPTDPLVWQSYQSIEESVMANASLSLFTAPGAARAYRERYPHAAIEVLENGYDEEAFQRAERLPIATAANAGSAITLLHSGIVYPSERDPSALFAAFARLAKASGPEFPLRLRFRAPVHDELLRNLAGGHGVERFVDILPALDYTDALAEMMAADGLLVLQAANCNEQIPAKVYEYLRARRPIVALTEPEGDTGRMLAAAGIEPIVRLTDADAIERRLADFVASRQAQPVPDDAVIARASRRSRARELATFLDRHA